MFSDYPKKLLLPLEFCLNSADSVSMRLLIKKLNLTKWVLGSMILTGGCQEPSVRQNTSPVYALTTETHTAALSDRNYVDIVWVIDDSGSMGPYQEAVAGAFADFIGNFEQTDLDFIFSVISTSVSGGEAADGKMNNTRQSLTSNALKTNPETFSRNFKSSVQIGTGGSGDEQAMWNLKRHFERFGPTGQTPYLREFAETIVFYLSDEKDNSGNEPAASEPKDPEAGIAIDDSTGLAYLEQYKLILGKDQLKFFAILNPAIADARWTALTEATGGSIASILEDYTVTLNNLGSYVAQQRSFNNIYLEQSAKADGAMTVTVNGTVLAAENWKFYWDFQLLRINDGFINEGDSVEVEFDTQVNPDYIPGTL